LRQKLGYASNLSWPKPDRAAFIDGQPMAGSLLSFPKTPKRFKSSYICFFMAKQPEVKEELGEAATVMAISKRSAEMW